MSPLSNNVLTVRAECGFWYSLCNEYKNTHTHTENRRTDTADPGGLERAFINVPVLTCSLHLHQHANHCAWQWGKSWYEKCQFRVSLKIHAAAPEAPAVTDEQTDERADRSACAYFHLGLEKVREIRRRVAE